MVNTSKILTVSYGTFSCTLEGFDDSFETMKAIAEYFRDLAADDRYFGAEPPTPDADMLARIAEREIARRVEAHEEQGKIVLRAEDAPALATAAVASADVADASHDEPTPETPEEAAPEAEAPAADAVQEMAALAEVEDVITEETSVAESAAEASDEAVSEIEDIVAEDTSEPEMPTVDMHGEEAAEPESYGTYVVTAMDIPAETDDDDTVNAETDVEVDAVSEFFNADNTAFSEAEDNTPEPEAHENFLDEYASEEESESDVLSNDEDAKDHSELDASPVEEHIETAEEFFQNSPTPDAPSLYESEDAETPVAEPDSVAAKLNAIRSVVSQSEDSYESDDYSEDEHAQDFLNDTAADLDAALALDDAAELDAVKGESSVETMDAELLMSLADKRAREIDEENALQQDAVSDEMETDDTEAGFEDTLSQLLTDSVADETAPSEEVRYDSVDESAFEEVDSEETQLTGWETEADDVANMEAPSSDEVMASDYALNDSPAAEFEESDEEPAAHVNARVIKMTSDEFEAAMGDSVQGDSDVEVSLDELHGDEEADVVHPDAVLSPEQEEELQRELAEVDADLESESAESADDFDAPLADDETLDAETDEADEEQPVATREGRHKFDATDATSDIERIFDEADNQLEKPESNQRRSAIQHLRAAVAATRAEKKAGADLQKDVDDTPYRSDLANVVRPRRPSATEGTRSERPVESRPAPLKLVAEQRIDTEQAPIRPRRVSATTEQMPEPDMATLDSDSNFTEYARQMGATQLPDLLEAAAAYMSDVEGRDQFSRPMLMHKLQEVEKENFSREDGLRSFGTLLRQGKIQKIKGGRFTVTEETDFRDDARHAG